MSRTCRRTLPLFGLLSLLASALHGQSLAGTWQGTLHEGPRPLRLKFEIVRSDDNRFAATLWSLDEGGSGGIDPSYHTDTARDQSVLSTGWRDSPWDNRGHHDYRHLRTEFPL